MTGTIVYIDHKGRGEIRTPDLASRIRFAAGELIDLPLVSALGAVVDFDVVAHNAVRVRPAGSPLVLRLNGKTDHQTSARRSKNGRTKNRILNPIP